MLARRTAGLAPVKIGSTMLLLAILAAFGSGGGAAAAAAPSEAPVSAAVIRPTAVFYTTTELHTVGYIPNTAVLGTALETGLPAADPDACAHACHNRPGDCSYFRHCALQVRGRQVQRCPECSCGTLPAADGPSALHSCCNSLCPPGCGGTAPGGRKGGPEGPAWRHLQNVHAVPLPLQEGCSDGLGGSLGYQQCTLLAASCSPTPPAAARGVPAQVTSGEGPTQPALLTRPPIGRPAGFGGPHAAALALHCPPACRRHTALSTLYDFRFQMPPPHTHSNPPAHPLLAGFLVHHLIPETFNGIPGVLAQGIAGADYSCPQSEVPGMCAFKSTLTAVTLCAASGSICRGVQVQMNGTDGCSAEPLAILKADVLTPANSFVSSDVYTLLFSGGQAEVGRPLPPAAWAAGGSGAEGCRAAGSRQLV